MEQKIILTKLNVALLNLFISDQYLLEKDSCERAIAHCLAIHLKNQFHDYDVDCEYNINIDSPKGRKEILLTNEELIKFNKSKIKRSCFNFEDEDYYVVSVYPDIIIHQRSKNDRNLLILELKKSNSEISDEYDKLKLHRYTDQSKLKSLRYLYGVLIVVHTKLYGNYKFEISLYQNGKIQKEYIFQSGNYNLTIF